MLKPLFSGSFKKERLLMKKRGKDMNELNEVLDMIINEQPLPKRCRPHPLRGDRRGYTECHIEPDWLLVYKVEPIKGEVLFSSTGTHSDLF